MYTSLTTAALAIKRQSSVGTAQPAMTDANGNVVPFVASQVYKAATENGLQ